MSQKQKTNNNNNKPGHQAVDIHTYRPGTTKGKIDAHDIWVVEIKMPKQLIGNMKHGQDEIETTDDPSEGTGSINDIV